MQMSQLVSSKRLMSLRNFCMEEEHEDEEDEDKENGKKGWVSGEDSDLLSEVSELSRDSGVCLCQ